MMKVKEKGNVALKQNYFITFQKVLSSEQFMSNFYKYIFLQSAKKAYFISLTCSCKDVRDPSNFPNWLLEIFSVTLNYVMVNLPTQNMLFKSLLVVSTKVHVVTSEYYIQPPHCISKSSTCCFLSLWLALLLVNVMGTGNTVA